MYHSLMIKGSIIDRDGKRVSYELGATVPWDIMMSMIKRHMRNPHFRMSYIAVDGEFLPVVQKVNCGVDGWL